MNRKAAAPQKQKPETTGRDNDLHKGAKEEDRPGLEGSSHPGLDENGMPNDSVAIAQDVVGVAADAPGG